jgi:hypothetical protein
MMLESNKNLLLQGFEDFSKDNVANTVSLLEQIHANVSYLATAADYQANSRFVLRENRELLSKDDLADF